MPRLLEIVYDSGPILDTVFAAQRRLLLEEIGKSGFLTLDFQGYGRKERAKLLREAGKHLWDAVLIRGIRGVPEVLAFLRNVPFFLDHVGGYDFSVRGEMAPYAFKLRRAFCYSPQADHELRHAGFGKLTMMAGPYLPEMRTPFPEGKETRPVLGVLDLGHGARQALARIKAVKLSQGWDFDIITTLKDTEARQVESHFEVAEQCHLLACPVESSDQGIPHEGAILALSIGRPLATSQTSSLIPLPVPHGSYVPIEKYSLGGYGTCWDIYRRNPARYDQRILSAKTDHTRPVREILRSL
jgi:hypothetical protein